MNLKIILKYTMSCNFSENLESIGFLYFFDIFKSKLLVGISNIITIEYKKILPRFLIADYPSNLD